MEVSWFEILLGKKPVRIRIPGRAARAERRSSSTTPRRRRRRDTPRKLQRISTIYVGGKQDTSDFAILPRVRQLACLPFCSWSFVGAKNWRLSARKRGDVPTNGGLKAVERPHALRGVHVEICSPQRRSASRQCPAPPKDTIAYNKPQRTPGPPDQHPTRPFVFFTGGAGRAARGNIASHDRH